MNKLITQEFDPNTTLGIHGTSIEQVIEALKKGKFEKERFSKKENPNSSKSIHFITNLEYFREYFSSIGVNGDNYDFKKMIETAKMWARDIGFRHYLAIHTNDTKPLGWHVVMWEMDKYIEGLTVRNAPIEFPFEDIVKRIQPGGGTWGLDILDHIKSQGISEQHLYQLLQEGFERKGCLIGLNEKCRELKVEQGDLDCDPEAQLYIPKKGLNWDYVSGIIPLSEIERQMLIKNI